MLVASQLSGMQVSEFVCFAEASRLEAIALRLEAIPISNTSGQSTSVICVYRYTHD